MTKNVNLRLGDMLHGELKAAAEIDHRSLNSEIEALLELALHARQREIERARRRETRRELTPAERAVWIAWNNWVVRHDADRAAVEHVAREVEMEPAEVASILSPAYPGLVPWDEAGA